MENPKTPETTPSWSSLNRVEEERGAGGKVRKPAAKRPQATPYSRPPNQNRRWLSRLVVDPACRLISGGANLIFPSLFTKPPPTSSEDALPDVAEEEETDRLDDTLQDNTRHGDSGEGVDSAVNHVAVRTVVETSTNRAADMSKSSFGVDGHERHQEANISEHCGLSEIEQLVKEKQFSRDEINRLLEIMRCKAVDAPIVEQENTGGSAFVLEDSGKSTGERQKRLNTPIFGTLKNQETKCPSGVEGIGRNDDVLQSSKKSTEKKHEVWSRAGPSTPLPQSTSTPLPQSTSIPLLSLNPQYDIGASPVDIARAYMKNRASELALTSKSSILKDDTLHQGNEQVRKSLVTSSSKSIHWPGAIIQDRYMTPQSQRGKHGLNFARSHYSRSTYLRSNSKLSPLEGDHDRLLLTPSTSFQHSQVPRFAKTNIYGNTLDGGYGSVGPMRRARHKADAETHRGSPYFRSPLKNPNLEALKVSEGFFSTVSNNVETRRTGSSLEFQSVDDKLKGPEASLPTFPEKPWGSEKAASFVPSHSSRIALRILEHLDRNPATPRDKSAEIKLAVSSKKPICTDSASIMPNMKNRSSYSGDLDPLGELNQDYRRKSVHWGDENINSISKVPSSDILTDANGDQSYGSSSKEMNVSGSISTIGNGTEPTSGLGRPRDTTAFTNSEKDGPKVMLNSSSSTPEEPSLQKKPPSHPSGNKRQLPAISVGKPDRRWALTSDSSSGFTFPVSASSSSAFSEPPTPSIMPTSSASSMNQTQDGSSIPSFSFGSNTSKPALVFSFPSSSSAPSNDEASDLKFEFGLDKTPRISFSGIGKNAVAIS